MNQKTYSIRIYFIIYGILWLLWIGLHTLILKNNDINIYSALTDSIVSNILLFVFCVLLSNVLRYYQPGKDSSKYLLVWCLVISSIWFVTTKWAITSLLRQDLEFMGLYHATLLLRLILANLFIGGTILLMLVWQNNKSQAEDNQRRLQSLQLAREAELTGLRQQLQPHFLFNSLNSISALAGSQPEKARMMIQQLSDFLRGTLKKDDSKLVSLSDEMTNVELYLEIEKVRFGHRLKTSIEISESCHVLTLPPLMLQPLVENAIKFGLYDTLEPITISIKAYSENNELNISVQNPYDPETANSYKGTGFGLDSLKRRLFLLYNRSDLLKTSTNSCIFNCTITIPQSI